MAFTFTNYAGIEPQRHPLNDIIGKTLAGYNETTKSRYLRPQIEADIFHKQISPLAMLASSPYFSSLHPQQQQQIAGYISQMLSGQRLGSQGTGQFSGNGNQGDMNKNAPHLQSGEQQGNPHAEGSDLLVPGNPAEHFTRKLTESSYAGGTAHRGTQGETIYAPTGRNVQQGIDVLNESKGLKNLFANYAKIAPKVGGAGGFKRDLSTVASGIAKTNLPLTQKISEFLGGATLSNEAASAETLKSQMAPALRAIGFHDSEINNMLKFYPGETEKNIEDRLKKTWPIIERKIKTHQKNLNKGINVNQNVIGENDVPRSAEQKIARDEKERAAYEQRVSQEEGRNGSDMLLIGPDGSQGFVPTEKAMKLIQSGKFKEAK